MPTAIFAALKKQRINITPGHVSTIKGKLRKAGIGKATKPAAKPVVVEGS